MDYILYDGRGIDEKGKESAMVMDAFEANTDKRAMKYVRFMWSGQNCALWCKGRLVKYYEEVGKNE